MTLPRRTTVSMFPIMLIALLSIPAAQAAVLEFDNPRCPAGACGQSSYIEDGFLMTGRFTIYGTADPSDPNVTNGSAGGLRTIYGRYFNLQTVSGDLFSIESMQIAGAYTHSARRETTFYGRKANGDIVSQVISGAPASTTFATVYFSDDFTDLDEFWVATRPWSGSSSITAEPNSYDNFVVHAVPIPAAAWLFGSALAGLGWLRKRKL